MLSPRATLLVPDVRGQPFLPPAVVADPPGSSSVLCRIKGNHQSSKGNSSFDAANIFMYFLLSSFLGPLPKNNSATPIPLLLNLLAFSGSSVSFSFEERQEVRKTRRQHWYCCLRNNADVRRHRVSPVISEGGCLRGHQQRPTPAASQTGPPRPRRQSQAHIVEERHPAWSRAQLCGRTARGETKGH